VASQEVGAPPVALLGDGQLDTLALREGNPGLVSANDKDVALTGGEGVVESVLEVDNVETTIVALTVGDDTNTAHVTTTSDHGNGASIELDEVGDLARLEVNLDGVVHLDERVGVADAVFPRVSYRRESWGHTSRKISLLVLDRWFSPVSSSSFASLTDSGGEQDERVTEEIPAIPAKAWSNG
jgi:hypothetical protein